MAATPLVCEKLGAETEVVLKIAEKFSKLEGTPTEKHVADAVSFLASHESDFVTGLNLVVNGGFVVPQ